MSMALGHDLRGRLPAQLRVGGQLLGARGHGATGGLRGPAALVAAAHGRRGGRSESLLKALGSLEYEFWEAICTYS